MKKRLISMLLALLAVMGLLPTAAFAASTPEDALGEVHIYNGEVEMSYLSINGRIRSQIYTYYSYDNGSGSTREIPAYCVNPNTVGVPQTVGVGESIEYLADEKASDPKVVGIVANGYPTRSLAELGLENKYQGYYATKMALWCYLLSNWDINNLKVNPNLTGVELQRAQKILAAAKDIYARGTAWNEMLSPEVTCTPDRDTAYDVTIDGKQYKQQVFTFWSKTWVCDYSVNVAFSVPDDVPDGTRIVDMNNQDITTITTEGTGDGYAGKFKILYPLESVQGKTGSVQLSFNTNVYKYAVFFAICQEKDEYGELQNYVVDTDPTTTMQLSAYSNYSDGTTIEYETGLRILKYETGTEIPISGALFEVIGPDGDSVGTFVTNGDGRIEIPLKKSGNYTVVEREAPQHYMISEEPAQNVTVVYDEVAEVTFFNDPYGTLRIEKKSNTGMNLLEPGETPAENAQFLLFLCAVIQAVDDYQDMLRISVASAANDHRLGANEAPPAVVSMYVGDEIESILDAIVNETPYAGQEKELLKIGVHALPRFPKDTTDRNRTSPFAFTGNKFEFRMPGSSASISGINVVLNTAVAESLAQFADALEGSKDFEADLQALIRSVLIKHKRILFNGNGYDDAWLAEAERRGLLNLRTTPEALPYYLADKNVALFTKHRVYTRTEMEARYEIHLENYSKILNIEALTMLEMARRDIMPAVSSYLRELSETAAAIHAVSVTADCSYEESIIPEMSALLGDACRKVRSLDEALMGAKAVEGSQALANYYRDKVFSAMAELRITIDQLETMTPSDKWPVPSYGDLLFSVR